MAQTKTTYDEFTVTNAHIKWDGEEAAEELGATGSISLETELRTITKKEEGNEVLSIDKPTKMTGTATLHMPLEVARKVYGLTGEGLKDGIHAYGTTSIQGAGTLTFETEDVYGENKMLVALPKIRFSGGFKKVMDNNGDEIAEQEITFNAAKDSANKFYYQALVSELKDTEVASKWHDDFGIDLVKK